MRFHHATSNHCRYGGAGIRIYNLLFFIVEGNENVFVVSFLWNGGALLIKEWWILLPIMRLCQGWGDMGTFWWAIWCRRLYVLIDGWHSVSRRKDDPMCKTPTKSSSVMRRASWKKPDPPHSTGTAQPSRAVGLGPVGLTLGFTFAWPLEACRVAGPTPACCCQQALRRAICSLRGASCQRWFFL